MDDHSSVWLAFMEVHPIDAAKILERLEVEAFAALLEKTPPETAANVLSHTSFSVASRCLGTIPEDFVGGILARMDHSLASALLRLMEEGSREKVLACLPPKVAESLRLLLRYPEGTAGAVLDPGVPALPSDRTVAEALDSFRGSPDTFSYLYVTDRDHLLVGYVNLRDLLRFPADETLSVGLTTNLPRLRDRSDRASMLIHPGWRSFHALPVVDDKGTFLGAVRYETMRHLEGEVAAQQRGPNPLQAGRELGELFFVGLSQVFMEAISAQSYVGDKLSSAKESKGAGE